MAWIPSFFRFISAPKTKQSLNKYTIFGDSDDKLFEI